MVLREQGMDTSLVLWLLPQLHISVVTGHSICWAMMSMRTFWICSALKTSVLISVSSSRKRLNWSNTSAYQDPVQHHSIFARTNVYG